MSALHLPGWPLTGPSPGPLMPAGRQRKRRAQGAGFAGVKQSARSKGREAGRRCQCDPSPADGTGDIARECGYICETAQGR